MSTSTFTPTLQRTTHSIIFAAAACHLVNDTMQSVLTSIYPTLKDSFMLDFTQIGILTFVFQITASLFQPLVGIVTDRWPMPFAAPFAMVLTCLGLWTLAYAETYPHLILGSAVVGLGSSVFHPEASRMARMAAGQKLGFAQSFFQFGGNLGAALGPLLAALVVLKYGQRSIAWLSGMSIVGFVILAVLGKWSADQRKAAAKKPAAKPSNLIPRKTVFLSLTVLVLLIAGKQAYLASLSSYLTFYAIEKFGLSTDAAQYLLFLFLASSALGLILGGSIGDRYGRRFVIWLSVLGVIPFALALPFANLFGTIVLVVFIGLILSSAFSAMVVFAQELVPGRVGMISGLFFGMAFGFGGIGAAGLGILADTYGITTIYKLCALLPLLGLVAIFLPKLQK